MPNQSNDQRPSLSGWLASELNFKPAVQVRTLIFYVVTFVALIIIYRHLQDIVLIKDFFDKSNIYSLILLLFLQVATYFFIALTYRDVLTIKGLTLSVFELFPITFVVQFLNQALPSATISGQVFFIHYLRKYSITIADGISRAILEIAALYSAFGILFLVALGLLINEHLYYHVVAIDFLIAICLLIVLAFGGIFLILQRRRRNLDTTPIVMRLASALSKRGYQKLSGWLNSLQTIITEIRTTLHIKELRKRGWIFGRAILWQILVSLFDIATLYLITVMLDYTIRPSILFITFILSQFVSMMAFVPGAVGVFEGTMTLIFISFGVPANPALATTLLYRALTFWLPMPFGWFLYSRYTKAMNKAERQK